MNPTKLAKLITARNEAFKSSTPAERRILVAEDVLARIKSKAYIPYSGCWVYIDQKNTEISASKSLQKALLCNEVECSCCALGGLMLSNVVYRNNIETNSVGNDLCFSRLISDGESETPIEDKSKFLKLFSKKQLALIEYTFERGCGMYVRSKLLELGISADTIAKADKFMGDCDEENLRYEFDFEQLLVRIMENIIENNGAFKP